LPQGVGHAIVATSLALQQPLSFRFLLLLLEELPGMSDCTSRDDTAADGVLRFMPLPDEMTPVAVLHRAFLFLPT
jgi:hypothetical protein